MAACFAAAEGSTSAAWLACCAGCCWAAHAQATQQLDWPASGVSQPLPRLAQGHYSHRVQHGVECWPPAGCQQWHSGRSCLERQAPPARHHTLPLRAG